MITFFLPSLRGGGAERAFLNIANNLAKKGYDVDLVLAQKEGPYLSDVNNNVNVINLNSSRVIFCMIPLIQYMKKSKPDIFFSALPHVNIVSIFSRIISGCRCSLIITEQNYFSLSVRYIDKILANLFYAKSDFVIAVSDEIKKDLIKTINLKPSQIKVIYNSVDIEDISSKAKMPVDHKYFNTNKYKVIIGMGRLTNQKDFSTLIRSFKKVKDKKKYVKLIILGEGEERDKLEGLIKKLGLKNDVHLVGFVDNPYSYIKKSDVFVMSSLYEGLPVSLLEALACGVPVISTNCPSGPSEILKDGKYGMLVPVNNSNALSGAIINILEKEPFKTKALKTRAEDFSAEKIAADYLSLTKK